MAFHHQHSHGRVFNGIAARDMLNAEKRDSHGSDIKTNVPEEDNKMRFIHNRPHHKFNSAHREIGQKFDSAHRDFEQKAAAAKANMKSPHIGLEHKLAAQQANGKANVETVYSQVYVTASKTFTGDANYVTVTNTNTGPVQAAAPTNASTNDAEAAYASAKAAANSPEPAAASAAASSPAAKNNGNVDSSSAAAVTTTSKSLQTTPPQFTNSADTVLKGIPHHHTEEPSATSSSGSALSASQTGSSDMISQKSDGMTAGAKAGMAFGIIFAIALCGGLFFFCWRRRKQQKDRQSTEKLDEKHASQASFFSGTAAAVGAPAGDVRRSVQSNSSQRTSTAATAPRLSLRPVTQFLPNIMGGGNNITESRDAPQMSEKSKSAWERKPVGAGQNPFDDAAIIDEKNTRPVSPLNPFDEGDGSAAAKNSTEEPPTPKSARVGTAAAVPIAAAGAPKSPPGPNNVHRVQLDFKPSMDDELELRSGQIVRMLHEYDDGWCLCIRMDRSQQGVCPRTCLSKLPVKPRPNGPPPQNGPQGSRPRGPPPPGAQRPQSSAMRDNMVPRPLTPTGRERSQTGPRTSPSAQDNRHRSQSVTGGERPSSPSGVPSRKPVPGQAL